MANEFLKPGLHEALLTRRLEELLTHISDVALVADVAAPRDAEASDRVSRHLAGIVARAIEQAPEGKRSNEAVRIAAELIRRLQPLTDGKGDFESDEPLDPARVLVALLQRLPDGRSHAIERPLTPLLDTTVFTNAPGEPAVGHELRAEVPSADAIDVVMAFVRWSGVRPLTDALRRHCEAGKPLRVLTTTYTNSTEQRALDELNRLGAQIKVSYDTSSTRLHAKEWIFHRESGYSTAYIGSSNLTHSAQVLGLEWNVRISAVRNPDVVAKMAAVFTSYWESRDFTAYDPVEFARRTEVLPGADVTLLTPIELELQRSTTRVFEPSSGAAASCSSLTARRSSTKAARRFGTRCATAPSARNGSADSGHRTSSTSSRQSRACSAPMSGTSTRRTSTS